MTEKTFLEFPHTPPFDDFVRDERRGRTFSPDKEEFVATVKLHGSNMSVVLDRSDGSVWAQSRNRVFGPNDDHKGFHSYFKERRSDIEKMIEAFDGVFPDEAPAAPYTVVFGEWCGGDVQEKVALADLPKMFVVFEVGRFDEDGTPVWFLSTDELVKAFSEMRETLPDGTRCVHDFPTWRISLNPFSFKEEQETIRNLVADIERCCPAAASLGVQGVGEGAYFRSVAGGPVRKSFKVKGKEHSASNVCVMRSEGSDVDLDFVAQFATGERFAQGIEFLEENGIPVVKDNYKRYLSWVMDDLKREAAGTAGERGVDMGKFMRVIGPMARAFFEERSLKDGRSTPRP